MVESYKLEIGNCKELLKNLPDNSIDAIVTDPPYELGFMGKKWDASGIAYDVDLWKECFRVLKHGGHLLAFSGSRTYHRMTVAIEDAGFDIRDQIMWVYGSGFPKSHDVSKAIDKMAGVEREVVGYRKNLCRTANREDSAAFNGIQEGGMFRPDRDVFADTAPATDAAKEWNGWGTALKPAHEPICVARKPLIGTVAENVLQYGTGALNIDGCRVVHNPILDNTKRAKGGHKTQYIGGELTKNYSIENKANRDLGRWPANLIHDGSEEVVGLFPESISTGGKTAGFGSKTNPANIAFGDRLGANAGGLGDRGSAARFFYCAKASKKDRNEGHQINNHPTVKPTELMQYLCRLVTPQNGIILDPFTGSGSTGKAAILEGFRFIGFDMQDEYIGIAKARIEFAMQKKNEIEIKKENTLFDE